MCEHPVLIVGGGPVGLTLSIDLGHRGVECLLIDKRPAPSFLPKMERCHARTMEHFRRLGIADAVRSVGYPAGLPLDSFLVTSLAEPAIAQLRTPSVIEARKQSEQANDGRWPAEPSQIVSQYALEPLLKDIAENVRGVTVRFNCELLSFEEQEDNVVVRVRDLDGREETIRTRYLIGCDGGSSIVRAGLGFRLEGQANLGQQMQALFHSEDLFDRIAMGKGAHYYRADDQWTFLITQGDTHHFSLHAMIDAESAMPALFESIVGMPISYETLYVGKWTMRRLLSNQYASKRTFLAGDSAHLFTPNGGLGMNTGIGDAINLAWKLAAVVAGSASDSLLDSYEAERIGFARRLVATTDRVFSFATAEGRIAEIMRTRVAPVLIPRIAAFDSVREFMFRTVSQIMLNYRNGPLSRGAAGRVHGGERLPWVRVDGADNFVSLTAMDWQVHVYGSASAELTAWCGTQGITLHVFGWRSEYEAAGFARDALYLLRPDSYVALVDAAGAPGAIERYFADHGIKPAARPASAA